MPSVDVSMWRWRASLGWALLVSSLVLLIQVLAVLFVADAIGILDLALGEQALSVLVAAAVLVIVTAAQLSTWLWKHTLTARRGLLEARRYVESLAMPKPRRALSISTGLNAYDPMHYWISYWQSYRRALLPPYMRVERLTDLLRRHSQAIERREQERISEPVTEGPEGFDPDEWYSLDEWDPILIRFGLEPTWALEVLDEELGLPAARRLTRRTQMVDARAVGAFTALCISVLAVFAIAVVTVIVGDVGGWLIVVIAFLLTGARYVAVLDSARAFADGESRFYRTVERLLELHRFDLYRALALQAPRDSREEQDLSLAAWRRGRADLSYDLGDLQKDEDVRQQVAGLTDLLRGPELVPYDGFVSWDVRDDSVQLVFASTPVLHGGNARLEVAGSATDTHAPFDITANSDAAALIQVRASVQAPVDGRPARVAFDFAARPNSDSTEALVWFEISQRGRFIQLLRVNAAGHSVGPT